MTQFGAYLSQVRESRGFRKSLFSKSLGFSHTYINLVEAGISPPFKMDVCEKIIRLLNLNESESRKLIELAALDRVDEDIAPYLKLNKVRETRTEYKAQQGVKIVPLVQTLPQKGTLGAEVNGKPALYVDASWLGEWECFAWKVSTDDLFNRGIQKNDIVIVAYDAPLKNGDIAAVKGRKGQESLVFRIFCQEGEQIILFSADKNQTSFPSLLSSAPQNEQEIIGKVILTMKDFR